MHRPALAHRPPTESVPHTKTLFSEPRAGPGEGRRVTPGPRVREASLHTRREGDRGPQAFPAGSRELGALGTFRAWPSGPF